MRHLRPSVPTLEDVFARAVGERASRCRSTIRGTAATAAARAGRPRVVVIRAPASARVLAQAQVPRPAALGLGARSSSARCRSTSPSNFPQASFLAPKAETFREFLDQQGIVRLLRHHLRRRRPDRQRSPRQRAAALSVEAADARGVHRRQARDPVRVPARRHLAAGDAAAARADRCSPAASRSCATTSSCCRRSRCSRWSQVLLASTTMLALSSLSKSSRFVGDHVRGADLLHQRRCSTRCAASPARSVVGVALAERRARAARRRDLPAAAALPAARRPVAVAGRRRADRRRRSSILERRVRGVEVVT